MFTIWAVFKPLFFGKKDGPIRILTKPNFISFETKKKEKIKKTLSILFFAFKKSINTYMLLITKILGTMHFFI